MRQFRKWRKPDLILVMGTSLQVYPFAGLVEIAHETGSDVIIINQSATPLDSLADQLIRDSIGLVLERSRKSPVGGEAVTAIGRKGAKLKAGMWII